MRQILLLALLTGSAAVSGYAAETKAGRTADKVVVATATVKKANPAATKPAASDAGTYQLERDSCCVGN